MAFCSALSAALRAVIQGDVRLALSTGCAHRLDREVSANTSTSGLSILTRLVITHKWSGT